MRLHSLHLYLMASRYCSLSFLMSICLVWISFISSLICLIWWFFSWIFFLKESGGSSSFRLFSKDCMIGKKSTAKLICRQRLAVTKTCLQVSPRYLWDTESLFNFQSHPYHAQHVPVIIHTCKLAHALFLQALSAWWPHSPCLRYPYLGNQNEWYGHEFHPTHAHQLSP